MTPQSIGTGLVITAVCAVLALAALLRQAVRHADDRADLIREQLDAYRAGQASMQQQGQAADDDGDALECWEQDELERMEHFYADDAEEPAQRPGGTP